MRRVPSATIIKKRKSRTLAMEMSKIKNNLSFQKLKMILVVEWAGLKWKKKVA